MQRKKSLPDVQNLESTTAAQGSREMTREEISVLSSSRRDNVRRQMEELERYKHNPLMYIINPRVQVNDISQSRDTVQRINNYTNSSLYRIGSLDNS